MIGPYETTTLLHALYLIAIVAEAMTAALVAVSFRLRHRTRWWLDA